MGNLRVQVLDEANHKPLPGATIVLTSAARLVPESESHANIDGIAYFPILPPGEDYVVLVLDRRMGDTCGWMGSRTYSDSWDGGSYWRHIGYPGDLAGDICLAVHAGLVHHRSDGPYHC